MQIIANYCNIMQISANYCKLMPPGKLAKGKHGLTGGIKNFFGLEIQWKHQNGHIYL